VQRVRPVAITHPEHPVNLARRRAAEVPGAVFADQFENLANMHAHLDTGASARCVLCDGVARWSWCSQAAARARTHIATATAHPPTHPPTHKRRP
jgi:hypothetical protein